MKVTLKYEEGSDKGLHTVLKLTLPRKWKEGPCLNLKETFLENFASKHPEKPLENENVHLVTMEGQALADEEIVCQVLKHGDHIRIKPGAPPKKRAILEGNKSTTVKSISKSTPTPQPIDGKGHVNTKEGLEKAKKASHAFDYSKWDRLDLSDDDGDDCHPNIDKASWKRLMAQKRTDRRAKEDEKIKQFNAKIEKYTKKRDDIQAKIDGGDSDPQLLVDVQDAAESLQSYQEKLDNFLKSRKLTAEDVCETSEDRVVVSENAEMTPIEGLPPTPPQNKQANSYPQKPDDEMEGYDAYIKLHADTIKTYSQIRNDDASEEFLMKHPALLNTHCEGHLLLLTLDKCMANLEERAKITAPISAKVEEHFQKEEIGVARQHLLIQFILTLCKSKQVDPRDMVRPFFKKTRLNSADRVEGFEQDLIAFVERIRNRAKEKIANGEPSPLANRHEQEELEEEYEPAGLGPGGLDPNEVLPTLPKEMQEAFIAQDTERLKACLASLTNKEAAYHMKRCIDSGLWLPGPNDHVFDEALEEDDEDEEEEEQQQQQS